MNGKDMSSVFDQFDLTGKVAIITGSGRGLGKAMAIALGEAGADVVVTSRTQQEIEETAREIEKRGRKTLIVQSDITDPKEVDHLVRQAREGGLLGHVLSSGVMFPIAGLGS
jgi:7-alpha-hydroxysteroid dehydrogenase